MSAVTAAAGAAASRRQSAAPSERNDTPMTPPICRAPFLGAGFFRYVPSVHPAGVAARLADVAAGVAQRLRIRAQRPAARGRQAGERAERAEEAGAARHDR